MDGQKDRRADRRTGVGHCFIGHCPTNVERPILGYQIQKFLKYRNAKFALQCKKI